MGPITLSKADEMLWLGRYTERVYTTLREFFETYDGNVDLEVKDFSEFCAACDMPVSPHARVDEFLYDFLYDRENPVSMCAAMRAAFGDAMLLRPELGTETISYVELALINLRRSKEPGLRLVQHRSVGDDILAFWGSIENGCGDRSVKALVFVGKYVERIELLSRFGKPDRELAGAVDKLALYLSFVESPECLPIAQVLEELATRVCERGYGVPLGDRIRGLIQEPAA
ncbi:MAG: alpha-E domain-containing protein [Atopobiaceae bacterium]|jgi:uncharacterized alpha-E superfamily protein|nr:alpha-E domain-containing protein [Atopobiaceae bacterium]MCH4181005.1 alpha-E domain-containing protein [Atopobiaceae bacterium]MCH4214917.1 alpha-E domain-containing protein [Atopobiaceae bacterium]MCH4229755.1 alpha-E domain-containing protein [Atopobiaceae bacterium]MCH4276048.1 alpha-E domain-containing protein [Atopobiaceae bacterium]